MTARTLRVLVVDDEPTIVSLLDRVLGEEGCTVAIARGGQEALAVAEREEPHLALVDLTMPDLGGLEVLRGLRQRYPDLRVILMTAYATAESAVEALREGALDYMIKPFSLEELKAHVRRVSREFGLEAENRALRRELAGRRAPERPVGRHPAFLGVLDAARRVARSDAPILVTGETGSGKEVVARLIHAESGRRGPMLAVNCGAITDSLLERELFGHERGAFTGAEAAAPGLLEAAGEGTLVLDEIGEMSPALQVKLLRVLEGHEYRRVGGVRPLGCTARFLAATHRDLARESEAGRFRRDLWFRLSAMPVALPALRDRGDDVILLAEYFLERIGQRTGVGIGLDDGAREVLRGYAWPGNARELRNVLERAVLLSADDAGRPMPSLGAAELRLAPTASTTGGTAWNGLPLRDARDAFERDYLREALAAHDGNVTRTASAIGLDRKNLQDKMLRYGLREGKARD